MTFILSLGNSDQVIQLSDRRLSSLNGVHSDNSNKATVLSCRNGRFAIGYTGIAVAPPFDTQRWIVSALYDCAPPEFTIYEMVVRFVRKATEDFKTLPSLRRLNPQQKRLSVMFTGYLTDFEKPRIGTLIVTNFQDLRIQADHADAQGDFWLIRELESAASPPDAVYVQRVGAWSAMAEADDAELRSLLQQRKPARYLVDRATQVVRRLADRPAAMRMVGRQLVATVIPSDSSKPIFAHLRHVRGGDAAALVDTLVLMGPEFSASLSNVRIVRSPEAGAFRPPVLGRNDPCWCGSRRRLKKCHGKVR